MRKEGTPCLAEAKALNLRPGRQQPPAEREAFRGLRRRRSSGIAARRGSGREAARRPAAAYTGNIPLDSPVGTTGQADRLGRRMSSRQGEPERHAGGLRVWMEAINKLTITTKLFTIKHHFLILMVKYIWMIEEEPLVSLVNKPPIN